MRDSYTAEVRWEDGQWQASVREVPGAHTYAKTMTSLNKRLREVIVLMDDRPDSDLEDEEAFSIALVVQGEPVGSHHPRGDAPSNLTVMTATAHLALGGSGTLSSRPDQALQQAADARRRAADAEAQAEHATTIAVLMAQAAGISMRDAATLLGISHQRVAQIAAAAPIELREDLSQAPRAGASTMPTWYVHISVTDAELADHDELEAIRTVLEPYEAAVSQHDGALHVDLAVQTEDPVEAGHRALHAVHEAYNHDGQHLLALEMRSEQVMDAELNRPPLPALLGGKEVAKRLGISKQRLHQLLERDDFPEPVIRLAAGPVWLEDSIASFEHSWVRKPGRPKATADLIFVHPDSGDIEIGEVKHHSATGGPRHRPAEAASRTT